MTQIYHHCTCGCTVKLQDMARGRKIHCPDHKDGFSTHRTRACIECGATITHYARGGSPGVRCTPCADKYDLMYYKDASKKCYAAQQLKKGIIVNHYKTDPKVPRKPLKVAAPKPPKKVKVKKDNYRYPRAALTLEQAVIHGVTCIPLKTLFDFRQSLYKY